MKEQFEEFKQFSKSTKQPKGKRKNLAVIYTRVSTAMQVDNTSLETQLEFCERCAERKNLQVVKYFGGTNESAKTDTRKEFSDMVRYIKKNRNIGYIIVYNFKRFSRTGISKTYLELLEKEVDIISATQEVDTTTSSGMFQRHLYMEVARMDNEDKRKSSIHGMQKRLRKGIITGAIPFGYTNMNSGKGNLAELVINDQGKLLRKAFQMKAKQDLSHREITERLKKFGWTKSAKKLSDYFRNPVYCGLIISSLIPDEVIEGKHPPIVSREMFLKVNGILNKKNYGGKYNKDDENLPLKQFVLSDNCGTPFTGYLVKRKGLYYYKNNRIGSKENRSAKKMHELFVQLLAQYQISDAKYIEPLKEVLLQVFFEMQEDSFANVSALEKNATILEKNIEKIERRFVLGEIESELYKKYKDEFEKELFEMRDEIQKSAFNLSNLERAVENATQMALNLPSLWESGDLEERRRIQKMVFPDGIRYNREKDVYRTPRVNSLFSLIPQLVGDTEKTKNGTYSVELNKSRLVLEAGHEPFFNQFQIITCTP